MRTVEDGVMAMELRMESHCIIGETRVVLVDLLLPATAAAMVVVTTTRSSSAAAPWIKSERPRASLDLIGTPSMVHTHDNAVSNWIHRVSSNKPSAASFSAAGLSPAEVVNISLRDTRDPRGDDRSSTVHINAALPVAQTDLHLMSLLGASTSMSRTQAKMEQRAERAREKTVLYMKQFPEVGRPSADWGKTAELYEYMRKLKK
jgi:hypothetical protein